MSHPNEQCSFGANPLNSI
jgi:hypothetical protein